MPNYLKRNILLTSCTGQEGEDGNNDSEEQAVIGFWSGFAWLAGMTVFIALLSEYVVDTIEVIGLKCLGPFTSVFIFNFYFLITKLPYYFILFSVFKDLSSIQRTN